jgi:hypothetical protein
MVDYEKFEEWAFKRFSDAKSRNGTVMINSIFCDQLGGDHKGHLWCKPAINHFRCWKSGTRGNLFQLVSIVENCSYAEAKKILGCGIVNLLDLERKVDELLGNTTKKPDNFVKKGILLPPFTHLISDLPAGLKMKRLAKEYLASRKLSSTGLYFCLKGEYRNRIIIPYFDPDGILVYWNGRDIAKNGLRYRGPQASLNVHKEHHVFTSFWPEAGSKIYCTEGEFDALSLNACGFYGAALGGKEMSDKQIELLEKYHIVLALDNDGSGLDAIKKIGSKLRARLAKLSYILPAKNYKDWNELLKKFDTGIIRKYILNNEKEFDRLTQF